MSFLDKNGCFGVELGAKISLKTQSRRKSLSDDVGSHFSKFPDLRIFFGDLVVNNLAQLPIDRRGSKKSLDVQISASDSENCGFTISDTIIFLEIWRIVGSQ